MKPTNAKAMTLSEVTATALSIHETEKAVLIIAAILIPEPPAKNIYDAAERLRRFSGSEIANAILAYRQSANTALSLGTRIDVLR